MNKCARKISTTTNLEICTCMKNITLKFDNKLVVFNEKQYYEINKTHHVSK